MLDDPVLWIVLYARVSSEPSTSDDSISSRGSHEVQTVLVNRIQLRKLVQPNIAVAQIFEQRTEQHASSVLPVTNCAFALVAAATGPERLHVDLVDQNAILLCRCENPIQHPGEYRVPSSRVSRPSIARLHIAVLLKSRQYSDIAQ